MRLVIRRSLAGPPRRWDSGAIGNLHLPDASPLAGLVVSLLQGGSMGFAQVAAALNWPVYLADLVGRRFFE